MSLKIITFRDDLSNKQKLLPTSSYNKMNTSTKINPQKDILSNEATDGQIKGGFPWP